MEMLLEDIKCIPGVSCVFCFDNRKGIVAKIAVSTFSDEVLSGVGRTLVKILSGGKQLFADMQSVQLRLDQLSIFIIWITETYYLTVIHEPTLNPNLLSMTLVQTVKDLKAALAAPAAAISQESGTGSNAIRQILGTGPYAQIFSAMENSLAKIMGPMASIVFQDTLGQWIEKIDDPDKIPLDKLVKMLSTEIGDPEKIKAYEQLLVPHFRTR
jgi:hypothetical protein